MPVFSSQVFIPFLSYSFSFDGLALVIGAPSYNYTQTIKVLIEQ